MHDASLTRLCEVGVFPCTSFPGTQLPHVHVLMYIKGIFLPLTEYRNVLNLGICQMGRTLVQGTPLVVQERSGRNLSSYVDYRQTHALCDRR